MVDRVAVVAVALAMAVAASADDELPKWLHAREAHSRLGMVATGSPEATEAAVAVLERGGNAIDAAVTAALVLGGADADASGLGGASSGFAQSRSADR